MVKNTFVVDANVILRYLLADHPEHFRQSAQFMERVKSGEVSAFIPEGVLVECVYVLLRFYKVPRAEITGNLETIMTYKGIVNENRSILVKGLRLFQEKNVDMVDAIVHAISKEQGWPTFSFDKDLYGLEKN